MHRCQRTTKARRPWSAIAKNRTHATHVQGVLVPHVALCQASKQRRFQTTTTSCSRLYFAVVIGNRNNAVVVDNNKQTIPVVQIRYAPSSSSSSTNKTQDRIATLACNNDKNEKPKDPTKGVDNVTLNADNVTLNAGIFGQRNRAGTPSRWVRKQCCIVYKCSATVLWWRLRNSVNSIPFASCKLLLYFCRK